LCSLLVFSSSSSSFTTYWNEFYRFYLFLSLNKQSNFFLYVCTSAWQTWGWIVTRVKKRKRGRRKTNASDYRTRFETYTIWYFSFVQWPRCWWWWWWWWWSVKSARVKDYKRQTIIMYRQLHSIDRDTFKYRLNTNENGAFFIIIIRQKDPISFFEYLYNHLFDCRTNDWIMPRRSLTSIVATVSQTDRQTGRQT
jgi:hypothetical protein